MDGELKAPQILSDLEILEEEYHLLLIQHFTKEEFVFRTYVNKVVHPRRIFLFFERISELCVAERREFAIIGVDYGVYPQNVVRPLFT